MADPEPRSHVEALQSAVIAKLKAADAVRALVGARIFDEGPSDKEKPKPPYIYLGPVNRQRIEAGSCSSIFRGTFRLFAVSTEFGRTEAWAVIDAVTETLDGQEIDLPAPYSTIGDQIKLISDGDVIAPLNPKSTFADYTVTLTKTGD
jgi:hypothetical protein